MKPLLALLFLVAPLAAQQTLPLRKADAAATPEKVLERGTAAQPDRDVSDVSEPAITVYLAPKEKASGAAVGHLPGRRLPAPGDRQGRPRGGALAEFLRRRGHRAEVPPCPDSRTCARPWAN